MDKANTGADALLCIFTETDLVLIIYLFIYFLVPITVLSTVLGAKGNTNNYYTLFHLQVYTLDRVKTHTQLELICVLFSKIFKTYVHV